MIEIDRVVVELYRLDDRFFTELRKCVIIVAVLSADYKMESRVPENDPTGLDRAEI